MVFPLSLVLAPRPSQHSTAHYSPLLQTKLDRSHSINRSWRTERRSISTSSLMHVFSGFLCVCGGSSVDVFHMMLYLLEYYRCFFAADKMLFINLPVKKGKRPSLYNTLLFCCYRAMFYDLEYFIDNVEVCINNMKAIAKSL